MGFNIVVLKFYNQPTSDDYHNIDKFIDDGHSLITSVGSSGWYNDGVQFIFTSQKLKSTKPN